MIKVTAVSCWVLLPNSKETTELNKNYTSGTLQEQRPSVSSVLFGGGGGGERVGMNLEEVWGKSSEMNMEGRNQRCRVPGVASGVTSTLSKRKPLIVLGSRQGEPEFLCLPNPIMGSQKTTNKLQSITVSTPLQPRSQHEDLKASIETCADTWSMSSDSSFILTFSIHWLL